MKFGDTATNLGDAIVGLSPGHTGDFTSVDFDNGKRLGVRRDRRAVRRRDLDRHRGDGAKDSTRRHPDNYDQILLWSDQPLIIDAFAYELTVANEIKGLGQDVYDLSTSFGSAGRLRSLVVMDWLGKYPDDPTQKFLGENNTLSVLGQEVGHRWLAYLNIRDHTGATSDVLLGRDLAHWSFFFNSDASVMEGNAIQDQGGGKFLTTDAVKRYSRLDQYAMGLVAPSDVPSFFYVENPITSTPGPTRRRSAWRSRARAATCSSTTSSPSTVRACPAAADSPRNHRQAFIYIVSNGTLARTRRRWPSSTHSARSGRPSFFRRPKGG